MSRGSELSPRVDRDAAATVTSERRRSSGGGARRFDWLVVGAGLTGATLAERIASQLGQRVLVVDRRPHVAGNAYDEADGDGIRVHRYGAHIFHTSAETVWRYLSRFTAWRPYEHRVLAEVAGRLVPLPCNLDTLEALLGPAEGAAAGRALVEAFGEGARVPVLRLLAHPERRVSEVGTLVHDTLFVNYTAKQWGLRPDELDPAVTGRVPIVLSRDARYFHDRHQALPTGGYTRMVTRMLGHELITVATDTDHRSLGADIRFGRTIFTGPIDEYFDLAHGPLPYRSLRFEDERLPSGPFQPVPVVNHPNRHAFTRIIEHARFADEPGVDRGTGPTLLTREYPEPYRPGANEPYYPLPTPEAHLQYRQYVALAGEVAPGTVFAGRLAKYRYFDMDQAVGQALQIFKRRVVPQAVAA